MAGRVSTKSIINILGYTTYDDEEMVNIFKKIAFTEKVKTDLNYFEEYIIKYGDRWDSISQEMYGSPFYHWIILTFNDIKDPFATLVVGNKIKLIKPELITSILIAMKGY